MALNPFKGFRKYQKIWMSLVLLLCMVTFVLCTGVGGDLSDLIIKMVGRDQSPVMVEIDGTSINRKELSDLKTKRELANTFITRGNELVLQSIAAEKKNIKEEQEKIAARVKKQQAQGRKPSTSDVENFTKMRERFGLISQIEQLILQTKSEVFHFGGGVKFQQLIDHKLKLLEAERLGVRIETGLLRKLIEFELYANIIPMPRGTLSKIQSFVFQQHSYRGTYELTWEALREEFLARIAAGATMKSVRFFSGHQQDRLPLSPDEIWKFHRETRPPSRFHYYRFCSGIHRPIGGAQAKRTA